MPVENEHQFEAWNRLKPGTAYAVKALGSVLEETDGSPDALLDAYLFAKRSLAQSMKALLLAQLPPSCNEFHELRTRIQECMTSRYGNRIPGRFLRVPYGSEVHERLFAILFQRLGNPVDSARLRLVTRDGVHTERRARELRELGLDIATSEVDGIQYYALVSLDLDSTKIPGLVAKVIRKSNGITATQKDDLIVKL